MAGCTHIWKESNVEGYLVCTLCETFRVATIKDPKEVYSENFWDGVHRSTLQDQVYNVTAHTENGVNKNDFILRQIQNPAMGAAMDIGCCPGVLLTQLQKFGYDRVVGIDISASPEKIREVSGFTGEIIQGWFPEDTANLDPATFDLILAIDLFEHITEPKKFLRECGRLLRENGQLLMMMPMSHGYKTSPAAFNLVEHVYIHSHSNMDSLLWGSGFVDVEYDRWAEIHETVTARRSQE